MYVAWYNYTRRDGTTYAEMLLSRNGTKTGRYMILAHDVMQSVRCSDAWKTFDDKRWCFYGLFSRLLVFFADYCGQEADPNPVCDHVRKIFVFKPSPTHIINLFCIKNNLSVCIKEIMECLHYISIDV